MSSKSGVGGGSGGSNTNKESTTVSRVTQFANAA